MAGRAALVGLLLCAAAAAQDLATARRMVRSKSPAQRLRGVRALIQIDTKESIRELESAIKQSVAAMEKGTAAIDRMLKSQLRMLPAMRRLIRQLNAGIDVVEEAERFLERFKGLTADIARLQTETRIHLQLVRTACGGFAEFRDARAIAMIEQGAVTEPNPLVRLFYIAGLRHKSRAGCIPTLLKLLAGHDPRMRAAAVRSLVPFAREPGVAEQVKLLAEDENWAVRLGAYQVMAGAAFADAVEFLVLAASREEGEIALAVDSYLEYLTGQSYAQRPGHWKVWWERNRDAIRAGTWAPTPAKEPAAGETKTVATFFRIPIQSRRILFALDFSGSMAEPVALRDAQVKTLMRRYELAPTRLGYAQAEFIRAISALPDGSYFNVLGYNDDVKRLGSRMIKLTRSSRKRAIRWVLRLETADLTNVFSALREAFQDYLVGGGVTRFADLPDTVVLLSDGIATRGRFTDGTDLRTMVQMWNVPLDVVFHCVGIGEDHDRTLLAGLAEDTGGYYVDVTKGLKDLAPRRRPLPQGLVGAEQRLAKSRKEFQEKFDSLLRRFEEGDDDERVAAAAELGKLGPRAAPALAEALRDISSRIRDAASDALAAIGVKAVPALIHALHSGDEYAIVGAARALKKIGPPARAALPALRQHTDHEDEKIKQAVKAAIAALM